MFVHRLRCSSFGHVAHDTILRALDEIENVLNFLAHGDLLGNFEYGILQTEVACVDDAIGIGDVAEHTFGFAFMLEHDGVHTMVGGGVSSENDVGRHVFLYATSTLNEREASHANVLLNYHAIALYGAVVKLALASDASADSYYTMVEYVYVVADMHAVHDEILVADGCGLVGVGATSYHNVLADAVVVAYDHLCGLPFYVMEVLWGSSNDGVLENDVSRPHCRSFKDACVGLDNAVVANYHVLLNVGEGAYFNVLTKFCFWVNVS